MNTTAHPPGAADAPSVTPCGHPSTPHLSGECRMRLHATASAEPYADGRFAPFLEHGSIPAPVCPAPGLAARRTGMTGSARTQAGAHTSAVRSPHVRPCLTPSPGHEPATKPESFGVLCRLPRIRAVPLRTSQNTPRRTPPCRQMTTQMLDPINFSGMAFTRTGVMPVTYVSMAAGIMRAVDSSQTTIGLSSTPNHMQRSIFACRQSGADASALTNKRNDVRGEKDGARPSENFLRQQDAAHAH